MSTPTYPSWNDKEYDLLKKMTANTALIADYEIGDVASVAGTANQILVNGGTGAATGNVTLSLPSTLIVPGNLTVSGTGSINGTSIPASKTLVVTTDKLSALASTSSSELAGVISDETGTGSLVFANTPTLVTPNIGAATGTSVNLTGAGTFGGNLTVSGTGGIQLNSVANLTWGGSYGAGIPMIAIPSATSIGFYPTGSTSGKTFELFGTGNATLAGNLTVSGTGDTVFYSSNIHLITTDAGLWFNNTGTYTIGMYESGTNLKLRNGGSDRWTMDSSGNITQTGNLTVSGGTISSGTATLTLKSTANTVVLQSAGTTALTLDSSQNATFAGAVTVSGADKVLTVTSSASTPGFTMRQTGGIAANRNWGIVINNSANGDFILRRSTTTSGDPTTAVLTFDSTGNATFAGSIAIGNTVNTVSPTSPNRTVTIVIGGTTYYLAAKTTND